MSEVPVADGAVRRHPPASASVLGRSARCLRQASQWFEKITDLVGHGTTIVTQLRQRPRRGVSASGEA
jgi:hypothetical protein